MEMEEPSEEVTRLLTHGLALYEGDYLPERMHEDWCTEERERLQVLYMRGAEKLAIIHLKNGDDELCIEVAQQILMKDRCWEEAYRLLMEAYLRLQNRTMVFHYYQKCKDVLEEELGVAPMEQTQLLFEQIRKERADV